MNKYEKAKYFLLFYALKDEKIKERLGKIDFGVKEEYTPEEIEDYFNLVNKEKETVTSMMEILKTKLKEEQNPLKQAKITQAILDIKKIIYEE